MLAFVSISCKKWVTNVEPLVDAISNSELNTESQLTFLANGVETRFASAVDKTSVCAAGLSDAFFFDSNVPGATSSSFNEINKGKIRLDNYYTSGAYIDVSQLRFYADDLIRRTNSITISDSSIKNNALFIGYFYGGYARYLYAAFFGLTPTQGSPVNDGPFINSTSLYDSAIAKFKESLKYAGNPLTIKSVNSVIARAYLYKGDYTDASVYAANGLINGDPTFQALHSTTVGNENIWWEIAGVNDRQFVADFRFKSYIDHDSLEANRIKLDTIRGYNNTLYYYQTVYSENSSPQTIISWQENNLMRAELILRGFSSGSADYLVNEVRKSHQIPDLNSPVDLDVIYNERDKELFPSGNRLVDERRFNKWHLPPGTWEYLPIPQSERNGNPNIN